MAFTEDERSTIVAITDEARDVLAKGSPGAHRGGEDATVRVAQPGGRGGTGAGDDTGQWASTGGTAAACGAASTPIAARCRPRPGTNTAEPSSRARRTFSARSINHSSVRLQPSHPEWCRNADESGARFQRDEIAAFVPLRGRRQSSRLATLRLENEDAVDRASNRSRLSWLKRTE